VEQAWEKADKEYQDEDWYEALPLYKDMNQDYPNSHLIDKIQFRVAMCHFHLEDWEDAELEFRKYLQEFSDRYDLADDAQYYLAKSVYSQSPDFPYDQGATHAALEVFDEMLENYPDSPYAEDCLKLKKEALEKLAYKEYRAGRLYKRMGDYGSAVIYFSLMQQDYPDSKYFFKAFYQKAYCYFKEKQFDKALESIEQAIASTLDDEDDISKWKSFKKKIQSKQKKS